MVNVGKFVDRNHTSCSVPMQKHFREQNGAVLLIINDYNNSASHMEGYEIL